MFRVLLLVLISSTAARAELIAVDCKINGKDENKLSLIFDKDDKAAQWLPQVSDKFAAPYYGLIFDATISETALELVFARPNQTSYAVSISRLTGNGSYRPPGSSQDVNLDCTPNTNLKAFIKPLLIPDASNNVGMVCRRYRLPSKEDAAPKQTGEFNEQPDVFFLRDKKGVSATGDNLTITYKSRFGDRLTYYTEGHYVNPRVLNLVTGMDWDYLPTTGQLTPLFLRQCTPKSGGASAQRKF